MLRADATALLIRLVCGLSNPFLSGGSLIVVVSRLRRKKPCGGYFVCTGCASGGSQQLPEWERSLLRKIFHSVLLLEAPFYVSNGLI